MEEIAFSKPEAWRFRKEINAGHFLTTVAWIVTTVWWASDMTAWRKQQETITASHQADLRQGESAAKDIGQRIVRVETILGNMEQTLSRIDRRTYEQQGSDRKDRR